MYYVLVIEDKTQKIVRAIECDSENKAERVEDGLICQMNHEKFSSKIVTAEEYKLHNELAALRAERDEAVQHLTSVISWIGNWEPDFRDDSEWIEEEKIITDFLSKVQS